MNLKQLDKNPNLYTLELKGIKFTMSKKELETLAAIIEKVVKQTT